MILVIISFSMLFATLFLAHCILRFNSTQWPPMGMEPVNLFYPSLSTILLLSSGLFYKIFERCYKNGRQKDSFFGCSFILGLSFMVGQFIFWQSLKDQGIFAHSGIFGSIIYAFTWIHAAHVVVGLLLFLGLLPILKRKTINIDSILRIQNVGTFWHFLGIVWIILFVGVFLY